MTRKGWPGDDDASDDAFDDAFDDGFHRELNASGDDWDEALSDRPPPISAFDRTWRHPSELGGLGYLAAPVDTTNYPGRSLLTASALIGLAFAVVLVRLVTAEGSGEAAKAESTVAVTVQQAASAFAHTDSPQSVTLLTSTASTERDAPPMQSNGTTGDPSATTFAQVTLTAPRTVTTTRVVSTVSGRSRATVPSTLQSGAITRRSGVALIAGSKLVTTSRGLTKHARVKVVLPDGVERTGDVIEIRSDIGVAVINLDVPAAADTVGQMSGDDFDCVVVEVGTYVPCKVTHHGTAATLEVDHGDENALPEGSPVMTMEGTVIGLTTWRQGAPSVIELSSIVQSLTHDPAPLGPPTTDHTADTDAPTPTTIAA